MLQVPRQLFQQWPLIPGQKIGLWESPDRRHLHLGPVVGIIWDGIRSRWWDLLQEIGKGAEQAHALPIIFSIVDADMRRESVPAALCRNADGEWDTRPCPLPDVVYDRGTYPDRSARSAARKARGRLARLFDIPFINSVPALDKWETYRALDFFADTRGLCPETMVMEDRASLMAFIHRHRHVFLKNTWGTWGREVLSLQMDEAGGYRVYGYLGGRRVDTVIASEPKLWNWLMDRCDTGIWIVQRAVNRQTLNGRVFDFRIVLQKDEKGNWKVPHVLVNWAKPGEFISNRPSTSEFLTDAEFRPHWGNRAFEFDTMATRASLVSVLAASTLETRYGRLGELGLDIAPDQYGRPWLLEANAKPYFMPGEGSRLPFRYAQHLAEAVWSGRYRGLPPLTENGGSPWHAVRELI